MNHTASLCISQQLMTNFINQQLCLMDWLELMLSKWCITACINPDRCCGSHWALCFLKKLLMSQRTLWYKREKIKGGRTDIVILKRSSRPTASKGLKYSAAPFPTFWQKYYKKQISMSTSKNMKIKACLKSSFSLRHLTTTELRAMWDWIRVWNCSLHWRTHFF